MIDTIFDYYEFSERPLTKYLFRINFFNGNDPVSSLNESVHRIFSVDLPKARWETVTQNFMSTQKSYRIKTSMNGETQLKFLLRRDNFIEQLTDLSSINLEDRFVDWMTANPFDTMKIYLLDSNVVDANGEPSVAKTFRLYGCVLADLTLDSLDYAGEGGLSCSATIQYGSWDMK